MGGGETGHGDPVGGAADVVEAGPVAEFDRGGIPAVLPADPHFKPRFHPAPFPDRDPDELSDPRRVGILKSGS